MTHKLDPAEVFKVLGGRTRMAILRILHHHGPLGAVKLGEALGISTAAVSQHLRVLRQTGLVEGERDGYHVPYHINHRSLDVCLRSLGEACGVKSFHGLDPARMDLQQLRKHRAQLKQRLARIEQRIAELETEADNS
ncbi:MAG: metalloregulator ArsR/SmtB family transcription factor [Candidatus Coatesbacteria bacterium]|nr:metalloregulator ArsR/SmtB family transcription factor [Candidatus Coatesbacteria bacterium]